MKLSIIYVHYKVEKEIYDSIRSLLKNAPKNPFEIIVVDNSNSKSLKSKLSSLPKKVSVITNNDNVGFGEGCNIGAKAARGEILFFLNPDTLIKTVDYNYIYSLLNGNKTGIVAPLLLDRKGKAYQQGTKSLNPISAIFSISALQRIFPKNTVAKKYFIADKNNDEEKEVDVAPGTAFFIKKSLFTKIGGFDKKFFLYFEEFDLCRRVRKLNKKIMITNKFSLIHFWGSSTKKRNDVNRVFRQSRFYYFKKNFGLPLALMTEALLRISPWEVLFGVLFALGVFLRFHLFDETMILFGDQGWIYLSALHMIQTGEIPLLGIPSSVVWLHQGALGTYMVGVALYIGSLHPLSPGYLFIFLDILVLPLLYFFCKEFFSRRMGIIVALLYATSPFVLISARTPFQTSPIPLFTILFMFVFFLVLKGKHFLLPLLFFLFGLLMQLELSNAPLFILIILLFWKERISITKKRVIVCLISFLVGILPFVLYDLTHHFTHLVGFPLWIVNRIRLVIFDNVAVSAVGLPSYITIRNQLGAILSVNSYLPLYTFAIILGMFLAIRKFRLIKNFMWLSLFFIIPVSSFFVHNAPGTAYFMLVFVPMLLVLAFIIDKKPLLIPLIFILCFYNVFMMVNNNYYVSDSAIQRVLPLNNYGYGSSWLATEQFVQFVKSRGDRHVYLSPHDSFKMYSSGLDHMKFLLLKEGITLSEKGKKYEIYPSHVIVPSNTEVIFKNSSYTVSYE